MIFTGTELVVPAGKQGDSPKIIDLAAILRAEQRQEEVAFVTSQKAPELLREFNIAWRDLHKVVVMLASEQLAAERVLARRKAVLILEVVPAVLKSKGLSSNEGTRDAVIELDLEYQELQEVVDQIDGVVRYLKGKLESFENAFSSVKKVMGEDTSWMQARQNHNLTSGSEPRKPVYVSPAAEANREAAVISPTEPAVPKKNAFGKAKY